MSLRKTCSAAASGDCCCEGAPTITTERRSNGRVLIKLFMVGIVADLRESCLVLFAHSGQKPTSDEQLAVFAGRQADRAFEALGKLALIRKATLEGDLRERSI